MQSSGRQSITDGQAYLRKVGEQNDGNTHDASEAPVLLIDGGNSMANGKILGNQNASLASPALSYPYSSLLVDVLRKFGVQVASFGSLDNIKGVGTGGLF